MVASNGNLAHLSLKSPDNQVTQVTTNGCEFRKAMGSTDMSTFIEKTEFAVYSGSDREPDYWFDDKEDAIAKAKAIGGRVDQVDHYARDYTEIYNATEAADDLDD